MLHANAKDRYYLEPILYYKCCCSSAPQTKPKRSYETGLGGCRADSNVLGETGVTEHEAPENT